ncbi:unnamed protein product, partial [Brassica oleracea]
RRRNRRGLRQRVRFRLRNKDRFQILYSESGESELGSSDPSYFLSILRWVKFHQ